MLNLIFIMVLNGLFFYFSRINTCPSCSGLGAITAVLAGQLLGLVAKAVDRYSFDNSFVLDLIVDAMWRAFLLGAIHGVLGRAVYFAVILGRQ